MLFILLVTLMTHINAQASDIIDELRSARNDFVEHFRIHGTQDSEVAKGIETKLKNIVENTVGEQQTRALFELATIQRMTNQFEAAIQNYTLAAEETGAIMPSDIMFEAWLGLARAHMYGTRNHGAAAVAFERAVASAGTTPTTKQRYDIADYSSQIQSGRGELDAALLNGIEAIQLAHDDSALFYAQLDTGDVLQKFAESCDYRKLIDAKTLNDEDSWGACRRAVDTAKGYYLLAKHTAKRLGWHFLEKEAEGFINRLGVRLFLIEQKASFEKLSQANVFQAQGVRDVLVNEDFSAGASGVSESLPIGALIDEVVPESQAADPRSIYLRGIKADLDGSSEKALTYFQQAVKLLQTERSSLFDFRRRGTVIENRPELIRDLALRFLALGQFGEAFEAFESLRSRGLGELVTAYEQYTFSDAERRWIANVIQLESQASAVRSLLVETTLAGIGHSNSAEKFEELQQIKQKSRQLLKQPEFQTTAERLASVQFSEATLKELQDAVRTTHIPVLLYWVTHTNVIVWVVSPQGMGVKTVFFPEVAVLDKVEKLVASVSTTRKPFDTISARELHTYLIKPFSKYLKEKQVLIIPQGPLVRLPFEVLVDAETGKFLAEDIAISYAPNAAITMRALTQPAPGVSTVTAIYDLDIEESTHEINQIEKVPALQVTSHSSQNLSEDEVITLLGKSKNVHVLLHGKYNSEDPLQSRITLNTKEPRSQRKEITAAELLQVNWRNTSLAVFSSCEGGVVKTRISNEIFGIPWALLAGGVNQVVLSRWRVNEVSNATWMKDFYDTLASKHMSPSLAANAAMRKLINSGQRDPFFWAAPQVFGR